MSSIVAFTGGVITSWSAMIFGWISMNTLMESIVQVTLTAAAGAAASFFVTHYLSKRFKK